MLKSGAVTIQFPDDEKPDEKPSSDVLTFRAPEEFRIYVKKAAKRSSRSMARFVIDAVNMERGVAEEVADHLQELRAFTQGEGLNLRDAKELGVAIGRLAVVGLVAQKRGKR